MPGRSQAVVILCATQAFALIAAAQSCHFGNVNGGGDEQALRSTTSCRAAYKQYQDCLWGSSYDAFRASIVRQKCEPLYAGKLTEQQRAVLNDKIAFCSEQNEGAEGTMAISERATCSLGVIFEFATDIDKASAPLPAASFDCKLARTPVEKAICLNPQLGRAELLMSTAYKPFFNALKGDDRQQLIQNQRSWNRSTPLLCGLRDDHPSSATLACLVAAYKARARNLSDCSDALDVGCLTSTPQEKP